MEDAKARMARMGFTRTDYTCKTCGAKHWERVLDAIHDDREYRCEGCDYHRLFEGVDS